MNHVLVLIVYHDDGQRGNHIFQQSSFLNFTLKQGADSLPKPIVLL